MRTRIGLAVTAVLLLAVGIACFYLLSSASFSSVTQFDPVTGEPIETSSATWRAFVTATAPVLGVASVALAIACGAGVVASLVVGEGLARAAALRGDAPAPTHDVALSAPETLDG